MAPVRVGRSGHVPLQSSCNLSRPIRRAAAGSTRLPKSLEAAQGEGDAETSTGLAVESVPEERLGAFEPIGDGSIGQVESASRLAAVLAGVEEHLQGLDQLVAHPRI